MKLKVGPDGERKASFDQESAHLRAMIDGSQDLIWTVDLDHRMVTFNRMVRDNFEKELGVEPEPGLRAYDLLPTGEAENWRRLYKRALAEGTFRVEYSYLNGQWLELSLNPILIDGKQAGVSVFCKDITERKVLEEGMKASEKRFRTFVENAPCAIGINRDGVAIYLNQKFVELFGLEDPAKQVGRMIGEWLAPEWRSTVLDREFRRSRGEPMPAEYDALGLRRDGSRFPLHISAARVNLADGPATIGFFTDESERYAVESALKESESRFRSYFDLPLVGMGTASVAEKRFLSVNDRMCEILGYSCEELLTMNWHQVMFPDNQTDDIQRYGLLISGKVNSYSLERRCLRKDGRAIWASLSMGCVRRPDGTAESICVVMEDISERKATEEAIVRAEKEYRQIFEQAPEGIFRTLPDGKVLTVSPGGAKMLGYASGAEAERSISDLGQHVWQRPEDRTRHVAELEAKGEIRDRIYEFKRKDGTPIWVSMTVVRVAGDDGKTLYYQGYFVDVSDKKRLEGELGEHLREVRLLSEMSSALLRARVEKDLLEEYCRILVETGGYRMAWVGFAEEDPEKRVVPVAWFGHEEGYLSEVKFMWDGGEWAQGPIGRAVRSGHIEFAEDFEKDSGLGPFYPHAEKRGYRSTIVVPFQYSASSMACLTVYGAAQSTWTDAERSLMDQVAAALGYGIRTLRTAIAKDQYERDLRVSLEETIRVIADTVDQRDPYTAGHQRRVADLCGHIARKMGLAEERVHGLRLAASIHDLGKIGIPSEILSKPGRLTPIQYSLVKEHAQLGYEIIRGVHFPWPIADMVRQHHERLDGSGYPQGLKGDGMLLESKILAVSDVVEAMATHRPYRATLGTTAALEEITSGRGVLYDPDAVDACVSLFNADGYVLPA